MKFVLSCLLLFLAAVAQALSITGDRLLGIWEDIEDQKQYSKFIGDLKGTLQPNSFSKMGKIMEEEEKGCASC